MNKQEEFKRIINRLEEMDLTVHEFAKDKDFASDIYRNYKAHTGNIHTQTALDVYYLMDQNGDIPFIGNYLILRSFTNK